MMILQWIGACAWGVAVACLFMLALRREIDRMLARERDGPRHRRLRRSLRWVCVSSALALPALAGAVGLGTLIAFVVTRSAWLRREVVRGS